MKGRSVIKENPVSWIGMSHSFTRLDYSVAAHSGGSPWQVAKQTGAGTMVPPTSSSGQSTSGPPLSYTSPPSGGAVYGGGGGGAAPHCGDCGGSGQHRAVARQYIVQLPVTVALLPVWHCRYVRSRLYSRGNCLAVLAVLKRQVQPLCGGGAWRGATVAVRQLTDRLK